MAIKLALEWNIDSPRYFIVDGDNNVLFRSPFLTACEDWADENIPDFGFLICYRYDSAATSKADAKSTTLVPVIEEFQQQFAIISFGRK